MNQILKQSHLRGPKEAMRRRHCQIPHIHQCAKLRGQMFLQKKKHRQFVKNMQLKASLCCTLGMNI